MAQSSVGGVPTSGLGVATNVVLTGTGVTRVVPTPAAPAGPLQRGVSQFAVSIPLGGSVQITALPYDDAGVATSAAPATNFLKTAGNYAVLGGASVVGSAGAGSVVTGGDLGSSPTATITNFPPSTVVAPGVLHATSDAATIQAQTDLAAAIIALEALPQTAALTTADIGSSGIQGSAGAPAGTWYPGVYVSGSSIAISTPVTLDAQGNSNAVFVFYATASTITQAIAGTIILANGAQAGNVYWVNGSSWTSIGPGTVTIGNILAHTSITLGGGTLQGRALANIGSVTMSTTELITVPTASTVGAAVNAVTLNSAPQATLPSWYKPSNLGSNYPSTYMAPAVVDDNDVNPWTVRGRSAGQTIIDFQIPTFENTEGQSLVDVNAVMDETFIDTICAQLIVTVTGGTS